MSDASLGASPVRRRRAGNLESRGRRADGACDDGGPALASLAPGRERRRRKASGFGPHRVTLRLGTVAELFAPPQLDGFGGTAGLRSGIERLVTELIGTLLNYHVSVELVLPPAEITPDLEPRLRESIVRYCGARSEELEHDRTALRSIGVSALAIGVPLLLAGLFVSEALRHSGLPAIATTFLSDGLFLLVAWVGLWYPLDTLIYTGRPLTREIQVLEVLADLTLTVRPAAETPPA